MLAFETNTKKHYLSACLIAKDEMRYLMEWIAFHKAVGFDYFYIYDNDSVDETSNMLSVLQKHGICKYIPWPRSDFPDNPQVHAYRHMISNFHKETSWVAIIDADEFVVPLSLNRVDEILRNHFEGAASVLCNWRIFGSSKHEDDSGGLCIERFRRSSVDSYHSNNHVKSICRPELVDVAFVHNHFMKRGPVLLSDGTMMEPEREQMTSAPAYGHMQINHYYCKTISEFMKKRSKGLAEYPLDHPTAIRSMDMFFDADRNEMQNDSAFLFLEKTRKTYDFLLSLCKPA